MTGLHLVTEQWLEGTHRFGVWDVDADAVIEILAEQIREMYVPVASWSDALSSAMEGLDDVADRSLLEELLQEVVERVVPEPNQRASQPWLDLARNEAGEALAYHAARTIYGVNVVPRIENKEISKLPSRGIDLLGIGNDGQVFLLAGEVKSTNVTASPPPVVGDGDDCLRVQLANLTANRSKVLAELNWYFKHGDSSQQQLAAKAALLYAMQQLNVLIMPVLIRPVARHGVDDYGCFMTEHHTFAPEKIRFCLLRLPGTIEEFAEAVYDRARSA